MKNNEKLVKIGIVGVSGYSGYEALKILLGHPHVRVQYLSANNTEGPIAEIWPALKGKCNLTCRKFDLAKATAAADVFFLAVPHTVAMEVAPKLLKTGKKVIDLSGDYRLQSPAQYKKWYKKTHKDTANLKKAVYGLVEIYREDIKNADFVSNPGCYPTAALLGLAPMVSTQTNAVGNIIIDAKSGVSGAGKKASAALMFSELNENFKAYKVLNHQHTPEIAQFLKKMGNKNFDLEFVPHLLPVDRGILETIYIELKQKTTLSKIHTIYKRFYKVDKFVRVLPLGKQCELKNVTRTNYCDISLALSTNKKLLVVTAAIDNLVKGAAGQAVQNMNLMCGFKENTGL